MEKKNDPDPTKDAFFSDLGNMEKEISNEAYELVEHALSLIASGEFDDAIEILRQAIGLYTQIDSFAEVEALNKKISEVYLFKEQSFQDVELDIESDLNIISEESTLDSPEVEHDVLYKQADELVIDGIEKVNQNDFDGALLSYIEAKRILQIINRSSELQKINELIEDSYLKKAEFLQKQKVGQSQEIQEGELTEAELKAQKIKAFEDFKRKEEEYSNKAYDLFGRATDLVNIHHYDEGIRLYEEGISLLAEINWINEIKQIKNSIEQIRKKKERYLTQIKIKQNQEELREKEERLKQEAALKKVRKVEKTQIEAHADKIREAYERKSEEDSFQKEITAIIDQIEKMARDYEINLKKSIKKGELVAECIYPEIIQAYEDVRARVLTRGWKDQAKIYSQQIIHYNELLEKDKNLRLIEEKKLEKQKIYDESLKPATGYMSTKSQIDKLKSIEAQRKVEEEINLIKNNMEKMVHKAERLAREYDVKFKKAVKKGELNFDSGYPQIIELYSNAKKIAREHSWEQEVAIFQSHINRISDLFEKENKIRELEVQKAEEQRIYEETYKTKGSSLDVERIKKIESQKHKEIEDTNFQQEITRLVDNAEKLAREYEVKLKKSLREGIIIEKSPFLEIIQIYTQLREKLIKKGWTDQANIYANQINIYKEKYDKDRHLREIEAQKIEKQKYFEDTQKLNVESKVVKSNGLETTRLKTLEEEKFQNEIDSLINKAEKLAREYDLAMKKAIKEGQLIEKTPFLEIIEIYTKIRTDVLSKGWTDQALIYSNQIKIYQEKLESDQKLRNLELQKIQKQKDFNEAQKLGKTPTSGITIKKTGLSEEDIFENEIDELVNSIEKRSREYEMAIKRRQFEKKCPYLDIAEQYKSIREKVYARGWKDEAIIFANQIQLYQEKFEKDQYLRNLEAEKDKKKMEFKEALKPERGIKPLKLKELEKMRSVESEEEKLINQAMSLINEVENEVRGYELSIKKDLLTYTSPYEKAIENYEVARNIFQKVGWKEEARRLLDTITFYREKKKKDDQLRDFENEKLKTAKRPLIIKDPTSKEDLLAQEMRIQSLEKKREEESKRAEPIFNLINQAEDVAKNYEINKKKGILNIASPFIEIINLYSKAKEMFEKIEWIEQANQIESSIRYYQESYRADEKFRSLELKRIATIDEERRKREIEMKLAKEAEDDLQKQKVEAFELKKKKALEYDMKKEQAFNIMDLAKKELKQNNFDKAIRFYSDSEKIFSDIQWPEGIKMVRESINVIKLKKDKMEREKQKVEKKLAEETQAEEQIEGQIKKAKEIQQRQREQKKQEILLLQKEKEREKEISEQAYGLLEEGTQLKNKKKYEESYEKYILARNLFKKLDWKHEVSRINNDLLFILKKEMKQTEKIKAMQEKKVEEKRELDSLLMKAEQNFLERENIRKDEKRKQRENIIHEERDKATEVLKDLKYNEGILMLMQLVRKIKNEKLIKQIRNQAQVIASASQVPIITLEDIDPDENLKKYRLGFKALDRAQVSLSKDQFRRAISELNEAHFNLKETKSGIKYLEKIENTINSYKNQLGIKPSVEVKDKLPKIEDDDVRIKIAQRRAERKKRIQDTLGEK